MPLVRSSLILAISALAASAALAQQAAPRPQPPRPQPSQTPRPAAQAAPGVDSIVLPPAAAYVEELPGMGRPIDTAATAARRARLLARLGDAVVVVPAARERAEADYAQDNDFRQSNSFFYLTQLEQPTAWLVLVAHQDGPDTTVLLLPERNPAMERWTGVKLGPGALAERLTGIAPVLGAQKLDSLLAAQRARGVPVYVPLDQYARGLAALDRLRADTAVRVRDLRRTLDSLRVVKDDAELAALRRAAAITAEATRQVLATLTPGQYEYEIEAVIEGTFRRLGADRVGFPSIVGSGPNGTVLHYDANRRRTAPGELVVLDIGAEWGQYTADITRTFPVSGTFTPRQRALYELVLGANQAVIDSVRPGVAPATLERTARAYIRDHSGDLCGAVTCDRYFIHGVMHHIGMDVHDAGPAAVLQPGMVFTDEPGIYLPDEALGIRIEDDVLVTPDGHEVLTAGAPKTVAEIERLMQRPGRAPTRPGREE